MSNLEDIEALDDRIEAVLLEQRIFRNCPNTADYFECLLEELRQKRSEMSDKLGLTPEGK